MKSLSAIAGILLLFACSLPANAQVFGSAKLTTLHSLDVMDYSLDRSYVGLGSEIGFETYTTTYQLEMNIYAPRSADSVLQLYHDGTYVGYDYGLSEETSTIFSLGLYGRYYIFELNDGLRLYTNSGISFFMEHAKQLEHLYGTTWEDKFTNKSWMFSAGVGGEWPLDETISAFSELLVYFPIFDAEVTDYTIYEMTESFGARISMGVKLYL